MGKNRGDVSTTLGTLLLASATFGAMYWTASFALEQDAGYTRAARVIDTLMERAYGVETAHAK